MSLNLFYTMVQNSQKWPKTQIKGWAIFDRKLGPSGRLRLHGRACMIGHTLWRMVRWWNWLTRLTLVCVGIRYRLVQVRQNLKKKNINQNTKVITIKNTAGELFCADLWQQKNCSSKYNFFQQLLDVCSPGGLRRFIAFHLTWYLFSSAFWTLTLTASLYLHVCSTMRLATFLPS